MEWKKKVRQEFRAKSVCQYNRGTSHCVLE